MPHDAAHEPDALTMWFTRQRKAWWKKWHWAVIAAIVLRAIAFLISLALLGISQFPELQTTAWYLSVSTYIQTYNVVDSYSYYLFILIAVLIGSAESKAAIPSEELALTQSISKIFKQLDNYTKRRLLFWVVFIYLIPATLHLSFFLLTTELGRIHTGRGLLTLLYFLAVSYLIVEVQSLTLRITVTRRTLVPSLKLSSIMIIPFWILLYVLWSVISDSIDNSASATRFAFNWFLAVSVLLHLVIAIILSRFKRKPPKGFTGTYES